LAALLKHAASITAIDGNAAVFALFAIARDVRLDEVQAVVAGQIPKEFAESAEQHPSGFRTAEAGAWPGDLDKYASLLRIRAARGDDVRFFSQ